MQPLIYDVAVSADGFISGPNADASRFPFEGPVVDDYRARLATYGTAIMGRATYEFGYGFGMKPGANPYDPMDCHVVSDGLDIPDDAVTITPRDSARTLIEHLKQEATAPLYICGGGTFAGWALDNGLIDEIRLKRAPILLGTGTPLFASVTFSPGTRLIDTKDYGEGTIYQAFRLT
ncbi:dihydrofolate reductase family protein [Maritimibacter dapengensis]|uniref:Dihydrofolate reductase family protein n=1 Tax=Maritimibacter dapengensis TaxID=2836868 RepID=A0ABS6T214_9RHOB|nr:dihydrofolate reductase family protein [Maritimibacter dapengensis]MBV7379279.1 dihydrofolate reductase family protein [Maritimibacter dapengensis]